MGMSAQDMTRYIENFLPFIRRSGIYVTEACPGRVALTVPLKGNENHVGIMYAGALFALAEITGGAIVFSHFDIQKYFPVVKELSIRFCRPAVTDVTVDVEVAPGELQRMEEEALSLGKSTFFLEPRLVSASGETVALAKGAWQMRRF